MTRKKAGRNPNPSYALIDSQSVKTAYASDQRGFDSEMAIKVLSKVTLEGKKILADKGYCSEEIQNFISQEKAEVCIPDKSNAVVIHNFDKELYKSRNIIERFFQRIKNYRHDATRYDKLSNCFLNFIILAAVMIQI